MNAYALIILVVTIILNIIQSWINFFLEMDETELGEIGISLKK
jgi:hypothetical protein